MDTDTDTDADSDVDTDPECDTDAGSWCVDGWCVESPGPLRTMWSDVWPADGGYWTSFEGGVVRRNADGSAARYALVLPSGELAGIASLWGTGSDDLWAAGDGLWHWDGCRWLVSPGTEDLQFDDIHGNGNGAIWAVGDDLVRWSGTGWSSVTANFVIGYRARVWTTPQGDAWVRDGTGYLLATPTGIGPVTSEPAGSTAVFGFDDEVWMPATGGWEHLTPSGVTTVPYPGSSTWVWDAFLHDGGFLSATDAWLVSSWAGTTLHFDGTSWSVNDMPTWDGVLQGFGTHDGEALAVDVNGQVWDLETTGMVDLTYTPFGGSDTRKLWAGGGSVWAENQDGRLLVRDPSGSWTEVAQAPANSHWLEVVRPDLAYVQSPTDWSWRRWDGTILQDLPGQPPNASLLCAAGDDLLVQTSDGVWRHDGTSWTLQADAIVVGGYVHSCASDGAAWSSNTHGDHWFHDPGVGTFLLGDAALRAGAEVVSVSSTEAWMLRGGWPARTIAPTQWMTVRPTSVPGPSYRHAEAVASDDVWFWADHAVGHWDGAALTEMPVHPSSDPILHMARLPEGVHALDAAGRIHRLDPTGWVEVQGETSPSGLAEAGRLHGLDDAWVFRSYGLSHWDGLTWTDGNQDGVVVEDLGPDSVFLADDSSVHHYDGVSWTVLPWSFLVRDVVELLPLASDDVYVANADGEVIHYDGTTWTQIRWSPSGDPDAQELFAFGGQVHHARSFANYQDLNLDVWDGVGWTPAPRFAPLVAVEVASATDAVAVDEAGQVYTWDGAVWSAVGPPLGGAVAATIGSSSDVHVLNGNGVHAFDGTSWTQVVVSPPVGTGTHGSVVTDGVAVLGGQNGVLRAALLP